MFVRTQHRAARLPWRKRGTETRFGASF